MKTDKELCKDHNKRAYFCNACIRECKQQAVKDCISKFEQMQTDMITQVVILLRWL